MPIEPRITDAMKCHESRSPRYHWWPKGRALIEHWWPARAAGDQDRRNVGRRVREAARFELHSARFEQHSARVEAI